MQVKKKNYIMVLSNIYKKNIKSNVINKIRKLYKQKNIYVFT